jgi:hypothetical protein
LFRFHQKFGFLFGLIRAAFKSKKLGQTLTAHGFEAAALTEGGGFRSEKLGQTLTTHGFDGGDLVENGFHPSSVLKSASGGFVSKKLGQTLTDHGFEADGLVENGFPPQAVWLTNIELFQFDKNQASRDIKAILGEDFQFDKITVKNN